MISKTQISFFPFFTSHLYQFFYLKFFKTFSNELVKTTTDQNIYANEFKN